MNWLPRQVSRAFKLLFPILEPPSAQEQQRIDERLVSERKAVEEFKSGKHAEFAIAEARKIEEFEAERRRSADGKATTYLAVVAALVPVILTLAMAIWDKKAGSAPTWINMTMLAIAVIYIACAGIWAFKVLQVAATARIGIEDFQDIWKKRDPRTDFVRNTLLCTLFNQARINKKVSGIKMTHAFLVRAFLAFSFLLLFNISWYIYEYAYERFGQKRDPWLANPSATVQAVIELNTLSDAIGDSKAVKPTVDKWCRDHSVSTKAKLIEVTILPKTMPHAGDQERELLKAGTTEKIELRTVAMRCGEDQLVDIRVWYVPSRLPLPVLEILRNPNLSVEAATTTATFHRYSLLQQQWPSRDVQASSARLPEVLITRKTVLTTKSKPAMIVDEAFRRELLNFKPNTPHRN